MKNTKRILLSAILPLFAIVFVSSVIVPRGPVLAAGSFFESQIGVGTDDMAEAFGEPDSSRPTDLRIIIARYIKIFLGFLGIIFLGLILYGGFLWMTDMGNSDNVKKAKSILSTGIIGLIVIMASFAIANFVTESVFDVTTKTN